MIISRIGTKRVYVIKKIGIVKLLTFDCFKNKKDNTKISKQTSLSYIHHLKYNL